MMRGGSTAALRWVAALVGVLAASPAAEALESPCTAPGTFGECVVPGWPDRPYVVYRPSAHRPELPTPVVLVLHGGNGNAQSGIDMSCPEGDRSDPSCMHQVAERLGFLVVVPNGTRVAPGAGQRQWNAGGGVGGWQCVGGQACVSGVADMDYLRAVISDVESWAELDRQSVFATGLSNGAALAHRMACEMADIVTAVAPVGGANQFETAAACIPARPVAILQIHGTADPCWTYEESSSTCLGGVSARKVGVESSLLGWAQRHGCSGPLASRTELDQDGDGVHSEHQRWLGCAAPVELARIVGGGHTFPDGRQYFAASGIGPTLREWGAERIWGFFAAAAGLDRSHLTGLWWTPGEDGWGLALSEQNGILFPIWYSYDVSGRPTWLIGLAMERQADGSHLGQLAITEGVPLASISGASALRNSRIVGTLRLHPHADGLLRMSYEWEGRAGERWLERTGPIPIPACSASTATRVAARNLTDIWWNPQEPGWGMHLVQSGDALFLSWYSYAPDGQPMWLVSSLLRVGGERFEGRLLQPQAGVPFHQIAGPATSFPLPDVGLIRITRVDGERADLEFTVDGVSRTRRIERFDYAPLPRPECHG
jgi:polyhydroxybutyrate depolymerase